MKTYTGYRRPEGCIVKVYDAGGAERDLKLRLDLRNHSPTGPEWGYSGSGPAQLALALAADVLGDDEAALDVYQAFKFKLVGRLPHDGWSLTEEQLRQAIRDIPHRNEDRSR
jgi:Family of unknown function (DUF6166)